MIVRELVVFCLVAVEVSAWIFHVAFQLFVVRPEVNETLSRAFRNVSVARDFRGFGVEVTDESHVKGGQLFLNVSTNGLKARFRFDGR